MPLALRRLLYSAFIAVFLAVAPLLVVYSMGYRYHPEKHRFERTGLIVLDGTPEQATVLVDGTVRATRLPARIGGLGENVYTLRVEQSGFHPWEQRVSVTSGHTTFATALRLFRIADPVRIATGTTARLATSADGHWAAWVRTEQGFEELWLHDLVRDTRTLVYRAPPQGITITWSPQDAMLLLHTAADTLVVDPDAPRVLLSLRTLLSHVPNAVQWELESSSAVIAVAEGRLSRVHLATARAVTLPVPVPETPFAVARATLYVVRQLANPHDRDSEIVAVPLDGSAPHTITTFPGSIARFVGMRDTTLIAEQDTPLGVATMDIDTTDGTIVIQNGYARDARGDAVLWRTNANELWMERGKPPTATLLVRRDAPLVDTRWLPDAPYAMLATDRDIHAVALDHPTPNRTTLLATFDHIIGATVLADSSTLLIAGTHNDEDGLWRLPL
ncbi:MAG: PEGA domain-containing protein [bacterium]|nr:PEGA domain-containing protein [bacterium]